MALLDDRPTLYVSWTSGVHAISGTGERLPSLSTLGEFLALPKALAAERFRLAGHASQASLIVELAAARPGQVELCSPELEGYRRFGCSPDLQLMALRNVKALRPSVGGWHAPHPTELLLYQMVVSPERGLELFQQHPLWLLLTHCRGVSQEAVARLAAVILDPRWFISFRHPDRTCRLRSYMGLTCPHDAARRERSRLVLSCWDPVRCHTPGPDDLSGFLWAAVEKHPGNLQRVSQKFVTWLSYAWRDLQLAISNPRHEPIFDVDAWYSTPAEKGKYLRVRHDVSLRYG